VLRAARDGAAMRRSFSAAGDASRPAPVDGLGSVTTFMAASLFSPAPPRRVDESVARFGDRLAHVVDDPPTPGDVLRVVTAATCIWTRLACERRRATGCRPVRAWRCDVRLPGACHRQHLTADRQRPCAIHRRASVQRILNVSQPARSSTAGNRHKGCPFAVAGIRQGTPQAVSRPATKASCAAGAYQNSVRPLIIYM
jgi:hypothetical protein